MKKLIAISVVFALVAGVAFAVDLGGTVIGRVGVLHASSAGGGVTGSASLSRVRLEGGGEVADGQFGGWLRFSPQDIWSGDGVLVGVAGNAWWKPIDQLKVGIGGNPDGIWGKEGYSGWMFNQEVSDTGVADPGNCWYSSYTGGFKMRNAFFGGFGDQRLFIEITPVDMVGINIAIPFFDGGDLGDIFMGTYAQVDLHMSFGNIAFTFAGPGLDEHHNRENIKTGQVFGFFSLTAIDNLQLDFGLGANFSESSPINLGVAVKYSGGSWGIKFRSLFGIPIRSSQSFGFLFDVLPYFVINENFRAYIDVGMALANIDVLSGYASGGWHVNPYIEIGQEWGPKFYAGIMVRSTEFEDAPVTFSLPIAIGVSF